MSNAMMQEDLLTLHNGINVRNSVLTVDVSQQFS